MTLGSFVRASVRIVSPTLLFEDGFAFSFYANEAGEPPHVHVRKAGAVAKWWLEPLEEAYNHGFNPSQRSRIRAILWRNRQTFLARWHETFDEEAF